ncbi:MAG: (2Fe-2S)-binding protein [Firmicutes bacterium]|jgi:aerobic-type carbon monoxide dehydrogenase small subunit (CoxS/CutS family)|nr:(2Fe-2S)-binding protein [Bacillota bacterium]
MRIVHHPVLGEQPAARTVEVTVDGRKVVAREGETIAAALMAAGIKVHRYTRRKGAPRGLFCAIGQCTDCVMIVNGMPNVRTCVTPVADGMTVETQRGGGPAQAGGNTRRRSAGSGDRVRDGDD